MIKRTGFLYKLGEGPINFNWNLRYCILEKNRLLYFNKPTDRNTKGVIDLDDAQISTLQELNSHPYSFTLRLQSGKIVHFSSDSQSEAEAWRNDISRGALQKRLTVDDSTEKQDEHPRRHRRSIRTVHTSVQMHHSIEQLQQLYTGISSTWRLLAVKQGLRVMVADSKQLTLDYKSFAGVAVVYLLASLLLWSLEWPNWLSLIACAFVVYKFPFVKEPRFKWVKASTIIDSSSSDVFEALMEMNNRSMWDCMFGVESSEENQDLGIGTVKVSISAPRYLWWSGLVKPVNLELQRYWMLNSDYTYYFVLKSSPDQPQYFEGFIVTELDADKTAVTMICNLELDTVFFVEEMFKLNRVKALGALRNFVMERSFDHKADLDKQADEEDDHKATDSPCLKDESSKYVLFNENRRVPLESRIPGYRQAKAGGIKCVNRVRTNQADLDCQKGLILDLIKRAGKTLMEGKHVVGVSLPVRIFEPRSTLERMVDWWCTLPLYLTNAARAVISRQTDPVERLKQVVTFAISGLYYGTRQLKPFNPILGETFQGVFLDGSEIFIEHVSHHPPISSFLVLGPDSLFKYRGFYEYKGKLGLTVR